LSVVVRPPDRLDLAGIDFEALVADLYRTAGLSG
jgi:hypothetical protein